MRYFIELSYNGKNYHGWQIQPNASTVQDTIETAMAILLGKSVSLVAAGRTDTGVHASQMFAHFEVDKGLNEVDFAHKLNSLLPKDIAIASVFQVSKEAHARFSATKRTYNYRISTVKDVFEQDFAYQFTLPLDLNAMNKACKILLGYSDFQCFSKVKTDVATFNCSIYKAFWTKTDKLLVFTIEADRFLRNMVRAIVGTMINIGLGKIQVQDLHTIINSKNRNQAGYSVPAQGLFLVEVSYPDTIHS